MQEVIRARQPGGQGHIEENAGSQHINGILAFIRDFRQNRKRDVAPVIVDEGDVLNDNVKALFVADLYIQNKR